MHLLIIGATGQLGRNITIEAVAKGHKVTCLIRYVSQASPNAVLEQKLLERIGARLVYGDLTIPRSLPPALKGISVVIDTFCLRGLVRDSSLFHKGKWNKRKHHKRQ